MSRLKVIVPVVAGAIAGAIVALIIAGGNTTKTVTTDIVSSSSGSNSVPSSYSTTTGLDINQVYKNTINGVVDITVMSTTNSSSGFFGSQPQQTEGEGAGVVYDKHGDIITDEHVVAGATSVEVHFQNGVSAKAKVLGTDPSTDVAVIKVNVPTSELHPIPFANSNDAQVGDPVIAIGSPFGLPGTTTAGIVSAVNRSITAPNNYTIPGAIQTDAAINPGNSGGPLLDAKGQVLGLNDQIQTNSGSNAGVGFATPANTDVQVANTIISGKKVEHPYVGVCLQNAPAGGAEIATSSGNGCTTGPVVAGSPAAKAGLQPGDVITAVDGKAVTSADSFISVINAYKPGQTITLTIKRSGQVKQVKVTLGDRPASAPTAG